LVLYTHTHIYIYTCVCTGGYSALGLVYIYIYIYIQKHSRRIRQSGVCSVPKCTNRLCSCPAHNPFTIGTTGLHDNIMYRHCGGAPCLSRVRRTSVTPAKLKRPKPVVREKFTHCTTAHYVIYNIADTVPYIIVHFYCVIIIICCLYSAACAAHG
jgi:hypothetical protein